MSDEQKQFEDLHQRGAKRFGWNWIKMNQWVIDAARDGGLDPEKNKLALSLIAYRILVNT